MDCKPLCFLERRSVLDNDDNGRKGVARYGLIISHNIVDSHLWNVVKQRAYRVGVNSGMRNAECGKSATGKVRNIPAGK